MKQELIAKYPKRYNYIVALVTDEPRGSFFPKQEEVPFRTYYDGEGILITTDNSSEFLGLDGRFFEITVNRELEIFDHIYIKDWVLIIVN